jgi:hypothetical protein
MKFLAPNCSQTLLNRRDNIPAARSAVRWNPGCAHLILFAAIFALHSHRNTVTLTLKPIYLTKSVNILS